ncbi:MAG: molybdenum cofactor guanylyltransferase [Bacteroidetes bacterium]|nr:molybdenum cofactor guanylyltransferase [Bacteroidota bacterium]
MNGLILAGGESSRMNSDKGKIVYQEIEIRYQLYQLLKPYCDEVYISINPSQINEIDDNYKFIVDNQTFIKCGPMTAILSAAQEHSQEPWLVLACDYPLVSQKEIELLLERRNTEKTATLFLNTEPQIIEPLIGIYEPETLSLIKAAYNDQQYSLRKLLEQSDCELITSDGLFLQSIDTPSQQEEIKKHLH